MDARSRLVAAVVAIALLTAGCTAAPTGGQPYETPLQPDAVASGHQQALADAGTYTVTVNQSVSLGGDSLGTSTLTARIDERGDRANLTSASGLARVDVYVANGTAYQRVGTENPQYRVANPDGLAVSELAGPDLAATIGNVTFAANGTTTFDGEQVWVYEATRTGENATVQQDLGSRLSVRTVNVTLYVREDGLVVRRHARATVGTDTLTGTFVTTATYEAVGSTAVIRPDWVDAATNATAA